MPKAPLISILICTRDRALHLRETLAAIGNLDFPSDLPCEMIVMDNGSSDETPHVVKNAASQFRNLEIRYLHEVRLGLSVARNAALAASRGEMILFTDDDIRPEANWLRGMSTPLVNDEADAVAGGVRLASHLERDWMTTTHRGYFACSDHCSGVPGALIGANMAFSRRVLEKVPAFDTELGPGRPGFALGFADDTLFSFQLKEAGFRFHGAWDAKVEHHFDVSRLSREALRNRALQQGRSMAYVWHHWLHATQSATSLRLALRKAQLGVLQLRSGKNNSTKVEGCSLLEAQLLENIGFYRQFPIEARRPRQYSRRGLVKLDSPQS